VNNVIDLFFLTLKSLLQPLNILLGGLGGSLLTHFLQAKSQKLLHQTTQKEYFLRELILEMNRYIENFNNIIEELRPRNFTSKGERITSTRELTFPLIRRVQLQQQLMTLYLSTTEHEELTQTTRTILENYENSIVEEGTRQIGWEAFQLLCTQVCEIIRN